MATAAGGWEIEPWLDVGRDQTYAAWAVLSQWRWLACGPRSPQAALPPVSDSQRRKAYLYAHSRRVADRDAPPSPPRAWYSPRYPPLPERAGDTPRGEPVDVSFALRRALRVRGPAAVARLQDTLWQWSAYARESAAERAGIQGVATMVQAAVRGFLERRRHRQRMRTAREQRVSAYVVAHWRAFAARKIEWRRRVADFARGEQQAREQERAASLIGARYRGHRQRQEMQRAGGRREWARARRERSERRERELASAARVEKSRVEGQDEADVRANESAHAPASTSPVPHFTASERRAALFVQRIWRGKLARNAAKMRAKDPWFRVGRCDTQLGKASNLLAAIAKTTVAVIKEGKQGEDTIKRMRLSNEAALHQLRNARYACISASERHRAAEAHFYIRRNEMDYRIHTFDPKHKLEQSNARAGKAPPPGVRRTELPWTLQDEVRAGVDRRGVLETTEPFAPPLESLSAPAKVMTAWERDQVNAPGAFMATGLVARREQRRAQLRRRDVRQAGAVASAAEDIRDPRRAVARGAQSNDARRAGRRGSAGEARAKARRSWQL